MALLFVFGLTESRVLGFIGLSRLLVTYIQLCMAILPIFVLITTVRSVAGDREAGVFEYLLSLPVGLAAWFWGKILGRYLMIFLPVFAAMAGAVIWALIRGIEVPWAPGYDASSPRMPRPSAPGVTRVEGHALARLPQGSSVETRGPEFRCPFPSRAPFPAVIQGLC